MSQRTQGTISTKNPAKILGIQFSILSPDEIRRGSAAEITSRDTYINGKPVIGGLFDPRMGVLDPGLVCPTDGLDYMQTPGYFGHIELAKPLYYIQYITTVIKIIRCTCIKCSKLLISKENYAHLLDLPPAARWSTVFSLASKIKRCGDETDNGCGCKQPAKVKKEGLATLIAEWDSIEGIDGAENSKKLSLTLTPELVLKQFRRISDEDVHFMGFNPTWSRPDWMICQVLAVPPPAVRPSVKHDSQQRSEDDITHIIVNIIKANKTLQEKIQANASEQLINDWATVLQYYVATLVDNKIPGVASVAQRSGRPLKSIKERLNGKGGRVRGNLMGKRVDYSARSVITPDPNLSVAELGVPQKIAMNLTRPTVVNKRNKAFLETLVKNGPDVHPGAKILERRNGDSISLRYVDRESIVLEIGDVVHRHMMNGDPVLFNRQPTLHRMSMMCHIVRIMPVGDTFRMNVADTKPYNADFDGDEMNLHMPQDVVAAAELQNLAAVPWQLISPANNKSIVGIFQDSLLGSYRLTRKDVNFTPRHAMNLLMHYKKVSTENLNGKSSISSFDLLSQILPPLSIFYKTKRFDEDADDTKTSNAVLEIVNGEYKRGQIEKGVLGDGSNGLIQRVCNDFGNEIAANMIDDLQNIVTEYMKTSAYSVGISDLMANTATNEAIADVIQNKKREVSSLIDQTHIGVFENKTGKSNEEEFETQINNILNRASNEAGKIGRKSLDSSNRFVIMVNAGSKGSELNISQMISCLGQQNVDGKRIPYGFTNRTLPHYTKYDDSPEARGFVESSFISGLSPTELFFHAMGGRVGLIDTAVKTSQTGYIQRRLVKGLEDLKVEYDMTVRNNKNKIIQFAYGDDGFDPTRVENQQLPLVRMSLNEIYAHFQVPEPKARSAIYLAAFTSAALRRTRRQQQKYNSHITSLINEMITLRKKIVSNVFDNRDNSKVHIPIAFKHLINNVLGQLQINANSQCDITPMEMFELVDATYEKFSKLTYCPPTDLFKCVYYYYLTPGSLLLKKRFNKNALVTLLNEIEINYKRAVVSPGEMVGIIAAQSIGEPTTQMTLNTFHFAGVASKSNVTRGVPRIEEILSLSDNPKNPSCTVYMHSIQEEDQTNAETIMQRLEHTMLRAIVSEVNICFDPLDSSTTIEEDALLMEQYNAFEAMVDECLDESGPTSAQADTSADSTVSNNHSKWILRFKMNTEEMFDRGITMDDVNFAIKSSYRDEVSCVYSDYNDSNLVFRIRPSKLQNSKKKYGMANPLDQSDEIYYLKNFQNHLLDKLVLRGIPDIKRVIPRKITDYMVESDGKYDKKSIWVLDTVGTNLIDILALDYIDADRTITNDIQEIYRVLGVEAARQAIFNEISEVIEFDSTYINYHHLSLLCDRMTCNDKMVSIFRHGINNDNIGPIAKASFEETPKMFLDAAQHAELDAMRGVSANVMCGQTGYFGTSSFQVIMDMEAMKNITPEESVDDLKSDALFEMPVEDPNDPCSKSSLDLQNNAIHIEGVDMGTDNDYNPGF
ncbi:MAG: hypothetical protein CMB96_06070 [Flavobacteriaceae bacterium]|nr:hypothetical protein [Flavobacteriaceae bacterium]